MEKRLGLEASIAIADVVGLCDADIVAAYPITPQTHVVEHLSELVANGARSLLNVCCYLLDRQLAAQASAFEREGGFTERLYRIRSGRRSGR